MGSKESEQPDGEDEACRKHQEELLDEALKETFPASDPPAITRPRRKDCRGLN